MWSGILLWFRIAFPWLVMLTIIYCIFHWPFVYLFEVKSFVHFKLVLFICFWSCRNSLYILTINSLPDIWYANIFSHSVDFLFTLLLVTHTSFLFWWSQIDLFFSFAVCASSIISNKSLPSAVLWKLYPMFASKSFVVLVLCSILN